MTSLQTWIPRTPDPTPEQRRTQVTRLLVEVMGVGLACAFTFGLISWAVELPFYHELFQALSFLSLALVGIPAMLLLVIAADAVPPHVVCSFCHTAKPETDMRWCHGGRQACSECLASDARVVPLARSHGSDDSPEAA